MIKKIAVIGLLVLSGCGESNKAPSSAMARELIDEYLERAPLCLAPQVSLTMSISEIDPSFSSITGPLQVLVDAGFFKTATHLDKIDDKRIASVSTSGNFEVVVHDYEMTDFGKKFYKPSGSLDGGLSGGRLCYASREVESIKEISPVTQMQNNEVVHVQFSTHVEQYPSWNQDTVIKAFPETLLNVEKAKESAAVLVRTPKGWKHKDLTEISPL